MIGPGPLVISNFGNSFVKKKLEETSFKAQMSLLVPFFSKLWVQAPFFRNFWIGPFVDISLVKVKSINIFQFGRDGCISRMTD